ncbi:hypothetical protein HAX54_046483 [Datura stramonium]|uniref:Exocyst subunit Exo70 family protein n=1 Tax=Datura stramonium TaxID=4076 RepID=A0ABS8WL11_DATST|nr:hypothetical protein [Datura stramonium]
MEPPGNDVVAFESAEKIILRWDSTASEDAREKMIFAGDRHEIDRYLQAVDEIQRSMESATLSDDQNKANGAIQIAMARLEDDSPLPDEDYEDDSPLTKDLEHQESNSSCSYRSTNSIREIDLMPSDAIYDLRCIAERMILAGYLGVYSEEKLSIGDIQRLEWETLETKIRRWIRAAKVCVRILFASEKKLCEQIFEAISISRRSPEKLFKILDLHDALSDLLVDIEIVFDSKSSESIRVQAVEILSRLAEAARGILSEFENAVLREPSKVPVPGGTIHPLTSRQQGQGIRVILHTPDMDFAELNHRTPLALHLIWIAVILQFNLEECVESVLKTFNAMFEEVHRTQSTWLIPDTQLREELRISVSEKLIPAYRIFQLWKVQSHIESGGIRKTISSILELRFWHSGFIGVHVLSHKAENFGKISCIYDSLCLCLNAPVL